MLQGREEVKESIDAAVSAVDIAYDRVSEIFQSSSEMHLGVTDDVIRTLMMNVFDLRNGLKLCAFAEEQGNGMVNVERSRSLGHRNEGSSSGSSGRCDCSEREQGVGSNCLCPKSP